MPGDFFLTSLFLVSNPCSRGLTRRREKGSCPGAVGPSGWRRWCWDGWRCRTLLPFTLILVRPSASTANGCSRVSFARACSVKVGHHLKSAYGRNGGYFGVNLSLKCHLADCRFNCHKRCASKVPRDCLGEVDFNGGKFYVCVCRDSCPKYIKKSMWMLQSKKRTFAHL